MTSDRTVVSTWHELPAIRSFLTFEPPPFELAAYMLFHNQNATNFTRCSYLRREPPPPKLRPPPPNRPISRIPASFIGCFVVASFHINPGEPGSSWLARGRGKLPRVPGRERATGQTLMAGGFQVPLIIEGRASLGQHKRSSVLPSFSLEDRALIAYDSWCSPRLVGFRSKPPILPCGHAAGRSHKVIEFRYATEEV